MVRLGKQSRLRPAEVVQKAVDFFGPAGVGLEVQERTETLVSLKGGGGGVTVEAKANNGGSDVDIMAVEWDYQANQFISRL